MAMLTNATKQLVIDGPELAMFVEGFSLIGVRVSWADLF